MSLKYYVLCKTLFKKLQHRKTVCLEMCMKEVSTISHLSTASIFHSSVMSTLPLSISGCQATPHHAQMHAHE